MQDKKRCPDCCNGQVRGGGCISTTNCETCEGTGFLVEIDEDKYLNKDSEHYQEAREKIKSLDDTMSDEDAEKYLDDEINKNIPKKKRK
jgi:hypothetical protein